MWIKSIYYAEYNLFVSTFGKYLIHFFDVKFCGVFSTAIGVTCLTSNKFSNVQILSSSNSMQSESLNDYFYIKRNPFLYL